MYRPVREQLSRDEQQDLLKKLLYQQGMCLLIYPEGSNTTLLTALAETIHTTDQTLHAKLSQKLEQDCKNLTLPKKLSYIYNDPTLTEDFRKYPELVNFAKIILELFSASTERRIKVFSLVRAGQCSFYLQNRIVNSGGFRESISIAKIENKYYNIKQNDIQVELSFQQVFKSSTQIDSEELIQTFKPETVELQKVEKVEKARFQESKPGKLIEDLQAPDLVLKKVKSSIPIYHQEKHSHQDYAAQYDKTSLGETQSLREETQLINECGPNRDDFNGYTQNVVQGMQGVMSPQQMYYLYYQSSYYSGKPQTYINYSQVHQMSPEKVNSQVQPTQVQQNYYTSTNYPSSSSPGQNSQNKRYTGRLKFFDEGRNYGFIIMDADESDIFVHYDDLQKAGISKQIIKTFKNEMYLQIRFSFKVMEYFGKYKKSRKAVQLTIMGDSLSIINSGYPLPE